ncbi:hypothetical protein BDEG_28052 [Batrachochytrium dendrobatidis JEL423]|nr:hypothetical protein BDEG_28052 [Batrachochytrium dendrobatidis JEL423]
MISVHLLLATVVSLTLSVHAATPTKIDYPASMTVPPPNPTWSARFLHNSNIHMPNIPVNSAPMTINNFTLDITRCVDDNHWGMTYDDGPTNNTQMVLDSLASHNLKATFFIIGSRVLGDGSSFLKKVVAAGHDIGAHTWSHPYLTTLTNEQIVAEFMWTATIIKEAVGIVPKYYRPPYGDIDDRVRAITASMGLLAVDWSFAPGDTNGFTNVSAIMTERAAGPRNGVISLEHDFAYQYAIQAPPSLDAVVKAGWQVKPLSECIKVDSLYSDFMVNEASNHTASTASANVTGSKSQSNASTSNMGVNCMMLLISIMTFSIFML